MDHMRISGTESHFVILKRGWGWNVGLCWASCSEYGLRRNRMDIIALETDSVTP